MDPTLQWHHYNLHVPIQTDRLCNTCGGKHGHNSKQAWASWGCPTMSHFVWAEGGLKRDWMNSLQRRTCRTLSPLDEQVPANFETDPRQLTPWSMIPCSISERHVCCWANQLNHILQRSCYIYVYICLHATEKHERRASMHAECRSELNSGAHKNNDHAHGWDKVLSVAKILTLPGGVASPRAGNDDTKVKVPRRWGQSGGCNRVEATCATCLAHIQGFIFDLFDPSTWLSEATLYWAGVLECSLSFEFNHLSLQSCKIKWVEGTRKNMSAYCQAG